MLVEQASIRRVALGVCLALSCATSLSAQDSTVRVVRLIGNYDPSQKVGVAVLPIEGVPGDSLRVIIERDLHYSDRFTAFSSAGIPTASPGLYESATREGAAFVVQATLVSRALHIALHDVAKREVVKVDELPLASRPLDSDWRMAVHLISDEIERWIIGTPGIAASLPAVGPSDRIAYMSDVSGRPEIYTVNLDGTGNELLTNYETSDKTYRSDPAWSPDGRWIAYQERIGGRFQLRAIRPAGGPVRPLTDDGENEQPSWAPDSRHIVFTSTRSGVRQLWVLDAESSSVRQLTHAAGSRIAAWSPRLTTP